MIFTISLYLIMYCIPTWGWCLHSICSSVYSMLLQNWYLRAFNIFMIFAMWNFVFSAWSCSAVMSTSVLTSVCWLSCKWFSSMPSVLALTKFWLHLFAVCFVVILHGFSWNVCSRWYNPLVYCFYQWLITPHLLWQALWSFLDFPESPHFF